MNGSLGTLLPSSVPSSLSSAVRSPDERRCALFSVGDEHAAVSRAASPAPIRVLLSTFVGSCPLPGLLWLAEAWSVIMEGVSFCADYVLGTFSADYVQTFSSASTTVGRWGQARATSNTADDPQSSE